MRGEQVNMFRVQVNLEKLMQILSGWLNDGGVVQN